MSSFLEIVIKIKIKELHGYDDTIHREILGNVRMTLHDFLPENGRVPPSPYRGAHRGVVTV